MFYNSVNIFNIDSNVLNYYYYAFLSNLSYTHVSFSTKSFFINFKFFILVTFLFKFILFYFIIINIFNFNFALNYLKQLKNFNNYSKYFLLNESEKEIGPSDDTFLFIILFIVTLVSFVLVTFNVIIFSSKIYVWVLVNLFLVSILVLTIPLNLFIDFGVFFTTYIKGTATSSTLLKEVLFDIIATFIVFIRFLIQNIRFLFIFLAIFELLEWVFSQNSFFFTLNFYKNNNIIFNFNLNSLASSNLLTLILNSIIFIILYFYYFLHLLFLLLVQISIYIGILTWLFFFLYSTKFLSKYEKFFIKKN